MPKRAPCRLRTHRRHWGLTQPELAFLLGYQDIAQISRIEREVCPPRPETVLACELLFDSSHREIFPKLFQQIEEDVMSRAYDLHQRLLKERKRSTARKREFLEACLKRAVQS